MEKPCRDIWIVSSDQRRVESIKKIIPDEGHRYTVFNTADAALAKMDYIYFHRDKKPDLVITYKMLKDDTTKEKLLSRTIKDDAESKKVPAIILPMDASLESEDFQKKFIDDVKAALARNKFFGLLAKREENLIRR